jgi:hypothetical protein
MTRDPYDIEQYMRRFMQTTMTLGDLTSKRFRPLNPTPWARYVGSVWSHHQQDWVTANVPSESLDELWKAYWEKIKDILRQYEAELAHLEQPHPRAYQRVTDGREFTPAEMLFHYEERKRNPRLEDMQ